MGRTRLLAIVLPLVLSLSCGETATPSDRAYGGLLTIRIVAPEDVPTQRIVVAEVILEPSDPANPPKFRAGTSFTRVGNVPVAVRTQDENQDGALELVVSFSGNPFDGRSAVFSLRPEIALADGGIVDPSAFDSPAVQVRTRLYSTITNANGATETVEIATGQATLDVQGNPIQLSSTDREVNVLVSCVNQEFCNFDPGSVVNVETNSVKVTVRRRPNCPTNQFIGDLYAFLMPNPLATLSSSQNQIVQNFDMTSPTASAELVFRQVPLGTYYLMIVQDVGKEFADANYSLQTLDIITNVIPVDVVRGAQTEAQVILDRVVGLGECSGTIPETAQVNVTRLPNCPTTNFQGDLYVFIQNRAGEPAFSTSVRVPSQNLSNAATTVPVTVPGVPLGDKVVWAALDVNPAAGGSFTPQMGDLTSSPSTITITETMGGAATVALNQVIGVGECIPGTNLTGQVVDSQGALQTLATLRVHELPTQRDFYNIAGNGGAFSFEGILPPFHLSVLPPFSVNDGGIDGLVSWLNLLGLPAGSRLKLPPAPSRSFRSATYTINVQGLMATGSVMLVAKDSDQLVTNAIAVGGPAATGSVTWFGPESTELVVAAVETDRIGSMVLGFAARKITVTQNGAFTLSLTLTPIAAPRMATVTFNGTGTFRAYPLLSLGGVVFPLPVYQTGVDTPTAMQLITSAECPGCEQFVAAKQQSADFTGCTVTRTGAIADGDNITISPPPQISWIKPAPAPPQGGGDRVSTINFEIASNPVYQSHLVVLDMGDNQASTYTWSQGPTGTIQDMAGVGIKLLNGFGSLRAVAFTQPRFQPSQVLEQGTPPFIPTPCDPGTLPSLQLGPGDSISVSSNTVEVAQ